MDDQNRGTNNPQNPGKGNDQGQNQKGKDRVNGGRIQTGNGDESVPAGSDQENRENV